MANDDDDEVLIRALRGEPTLEENADEGGGEIQAQEDHEPGSRQRGQGGNLGCLDGRDGRPPR